MRRFGIEVLARGLAAAVLAAGLAACGGGGGGADVAAGAGTFGAAGGTLAGPDGTQVFVPPDAFAEPVTVRITRDSAGAPALPDSLRPAGPVYAITPHGGDFRRHVEVTIPLPAAPAAEQEQRVLVTAEPGESRWRVLSGATPVGNALRVPVMQFSYFQVVTLVDMRVPTVTLIVDRLASVPVPGTTQVTADHAVSYGLDDWHVFSFEARVVPPADPVRLLSGRAPGAEPRLCRPANLGPAGASIVVRRDGAVIPAGISHAALTAAQSAVWPRHRLEAAPQGYLDTARMDWWSFDGPGVAHFWGQDQPRAGAFVELNSRPARTFSGPTVDRYTLPPAGNVAYDDELNWYGTLGLGMEHNGRVRIDANVSTDCGFDVAAVPLAFRLEMLSDDPLRTAGVQPVRAEGDTNVGTAPLLVTRNVGEDVSLGFWNLREDNVWDRPEDLQPSLQVVDSMAWETSTDGVVWRAAPELALSATVDTEYFDARLNEGAGGYAQHGVLRTYGLRFSAVGPGRSGYYRAHACVRVTWDDPRTPERTRTSGNPVCQPSRAYRLEVLSNPPTLTRQPSGQTVLVGETASLSVAVQGTPRPDLQWQRRSFADAFLNRPWTDIAGATAATYTTPALTLADHPTYYRVAYSNASGGGVSDVAIVSVVASLAPPVIVAQPGSLNVGTGGSAVFAVTAEGAAPLSYQWRRNGADLAGANAPILTLSNVSAANDGRYELVVSNRVGSVTSEPATLVVTLGTPVALPPALAQGPSALAVPAGSAANFAVAVTGTGPYSYTWSREGAVQPVGSDPVLAFAAVQPGDAGRYQVRVTNSVGTVLSAYAELSVGPASGAPVAPAIVTPPAAAAVFPGARALFAVGASGSGPLSYQWRRDGNDIAGATAAVLSIPSASGSDAGQYAVEVRNGAGAVVSAAVPLVVIGVPSIGTPPQDAAAVEGATASFSVGASGDALRYQWTRDGVAIAGATAASYTTPPLALADSGAAFAAVVYNGAGIVISASARLSVSAAPAPSVVVGDRIAAAFRHTCGVLSGGGAACWGINGSGQLGSGNLVESAVPVAWTLPEAVATVAAGQGGSCALTVGGRLYCAGNAITGGVTVPTEITGIAGVRQVVLGAGHACALAGDRSVWCWGNNTALQLGDGTTTGSATPVRVLRSDGAPLGDIALLEAGDFFNCAVRLDGGAACWGMNNTAQTGNPLSTDTGRAVAVGGLAGVVRIAAGANHACALHVGGSVSCWGDNSLAQLGNGTTTPISAPTATPQPVPGLAGVTAIASGTRHTCALIAGGSVRCWGTAPMGNGNPSETATTPAVVGGLGNVVALAAGFEHTCALRSDRTLACWGVNANGELGLGDTVPRTTPTPMAGAGFLAP